MSRRYGAGVGINVSYWYSKSLDYLSAMNLSGAAAKPLAGENDLAQNPFDLGPSTGRRCSTRGTASWPAAAGSRGCRRARPQPVRVRSTAGSSTSSRRTTPGRRSRCPTRPTSRCRPTARRSPGFAASRPNLIGDPNGGPHTVDQWLSRDAFQRLNPVTQAGQFGDAGRNIARGPASTNVDVSLVRTFALHGDVRLQFRAEAFNIANHANFGLPVADLNSANFGRILSAGPPRLLQFALKLTF